MYFLILRRENWNNIFILMFINELHLNQIEMPMAEDRFFDSVCVNPDDL